VHYKSQSRYRKQADVFIESLSLQGGWENQEINILFGTSGHREAKLIKNH
jgi:hypothetical protein